MKKIEINYKHYFWSFVLIFASTRGVAVYHFNFQPNLTYNISGFLLLLFGLTSMDLFTIKNFDCTTALLRRLVNINIIFLGFNMLATMTFLGITEYSIVYSFAIFPIIFALLVYDERLLNSIVFIIAALTTIGVIYFYYVGISGGFEAIEAANLKLRPGELLYSRIGENLLPAGYQGSHHDAANILVMCAVFFLAKCFLSIEKSKKFIYLSVYLMVTFVTMLTGSAANFIVLVFISGIIFFVYSKEHPYLSVLIFCCALLALFFSLDSLSDYSYLFVKASASQSELEGGGIFNSLDASSVAASLHAVLFGFGYIFQVPMVRSELAFIKQLVGYGFFPFFVLMFICFSPLYYYHRFKGLISSRSLKVQSDSHNISNINFKNSRKVMQYRILVASMPTLAGTLTLLHYGSLFRVTSIGLFCVLITLFLKEYIKLSASIKEYEYIKINF